MNFDKLIKEKEEEILQLQREGDTDKLKRANDELNQLKKAKASQTKEVDFDDLLSDFIKTPPIKD